MLKAVIYLCSVWTASHAFALFPQTFKVSSYCCPRPQYLPRCCISTCCCCPCCSRMHFPRYVNPSACFSSCYMPPSFCRFSAGAIGGKFVPNCNFKVIGTTELTTIAGKTPNSCTSRLVYEENRVPSIPMKESAHFSEIEAGEKELSFGESNNEGGNDEILPNGKENEDGFNLFTRNIEHETDFQGSGSNQGGDELMAGGNTSNVENRFIEGINVEESKSNSFPNIGTATEGRIYRGNKGSTGVVRRKGGKPPFKNGRGPLPRRDRPATSIRINAIIFQSSPIKIPRS